MRSLEGSRNDQTKIEPEIPKEIVGLKASMLNFSTGMPIVLTVWSFSCTCQSYSAGSN